MGTFVNDTFTEASDVALEAHVGETGAAWAVHPSYTSILRVAASVDVVTTKTTGTGVTAYYASGVPSSNAYTVEADIFYTGTESDKSNIGIMARFSTTADDGYLLRYNRTGGAWELYVASGGTFNLLGSYSQSLTTNQLYRAKLDVSDSTKQVYIDGTPRISSGDNTITGVGRPGIRWDFGIASQFKSRLDNYSANEVAAGGFKPFWIKRNRHAIGYVR